MELNISSTVDAAQGSVSVSGEIDVSNAADVTQALEVLLKNAEVSAVTVDLSEVPYIDSTGIGALVGASHRAEEAGKNFSVSGVQPNVERVFGMLGLNGIIGK